MTLYTLITAVVLSTGQFHAASVMENLTAQQCEQQMAERRETLRQAAQRSTGQRWYLACVPMPAAPVQP